MNSWPDAKKYELRAKQGLPSPFIEIRAMADDVEVPWDGETVGGLEIRGPFIAAGYLNLPGEDNRWSQDGWLRTGDVVTIDPEGYVEITDRTKDLIKSGGEWISSVDVGECHRRPSMRCRSRSELLSPHPKWVEKTPGIGGHQTGRLCGPRTTFAHSCQRPLPNGSCLTTLFFSINSPHTSTGKLLKSELRKQYANWTWQEVTV